MKKTVVKFGLMSGAVSAAMMLATVPFINTVSRWGDVFGYTAMVLSFLLVFFGIRSFREENGGVSFGKGLAIGLLIVLMSSVFYVATWESLYFGLPGFAGKFEQCMVDRTREQAGANADARVREIQKFLDLYKSPWVNVGMTFVEPLPVGLPMSLLAAFLLRSKKGA